MLAGMTAFLLGKLMLLYRGLKALQDGVELCLSQDTNTLLRVPSRDKRLCRFANALNQQLTQLRRQRQRYQQGDQELKEAVTNLSHDLRTPLTAVFGYSGAAPAAASPCPPPPSTWSRSKTGARP